MNSFFTRTSLLEKCTPEKYGKWALVAGASEGIGRAFVEELIKSRFSVLAIARRSEPLESMRQDILNSGLTDAEIITFQADLSDSLETELLSTISQLQPGLVVFNAAASALGEHAFQSLSSHLDILNTNCAGPLQLLDAVLPHMLLTGTGGIVLMSSLAGFQGSPGLATYAASKAFNIVLAESLALELAPRGVALLVSCAGATNTPNYQATQPNNLRFPGTMTPRSVAQQTLAALGRKNLLIPGLKNRISSFFMRRCIPRSMAVSLMLRGSLSTYPKLLHGIDKDDIEAH